MERGRHVADGQQVGRCRSPRGPALWCGQHGRLGLGGTVLQTGGERQVAVDVTELPVEPDP
ncbi:hypothetical protein [Streptomyces sp. AK04-3B]|uniref:hypothetical protein n=1 Tax=Streptomyces sp. AK04-3B TaxID=3028650 RepID=UPI0029A70ABF|nr:hypothetical protein [Streptomyces sp. AK04-3B]MDX3800033.1 hypothetical protein [Streptomyces sp. AK04-3B]